MTSIEVHVSPDGKDSNTGAVATLGSPQGPVRSLARARELARIIRAAQPDRGVRVLLAGGRHFLDETLILGPEDGGTAGAPVIWTAEPGQRATISGGRPAGPWRETRLPGSASIFMGSLAGELNPLQLWVNGRRAQRPRWPREGYHRVVSTFGKKSEFERLWGDGPDEAEYARGDAWQFANLGDVRFVGMGAWYDMWMRVLEVDEERRSLRFHANCWQRLVDETGQPSRYFLDNVKEALGEPGQWYHDRAEGTLYYVPRPGETADSIEAIWPALDQLVLVQGTPDRLVKHLHFENLTFEHCDWHPPDDFRGSIQAGHRLPGAVTLTHSESCVLYGCEVRHVAQFGVQLGEGSHDCRVVACNFHDLGGGGVHVDHEWLVPHSGEVADGAVGRIPPALPRAATVSDCSIHDGGQIYPGAVGIFVGNAGFCRILHNHVFDCHYSGISVGWTWGLAPTACVDNRIEGNHVHHCNWERTFSDLGLIYTLGNQPGSTIRGNHLHHVGSYGYGGEGIYTDEGSSGFIVEGNIVYHCRHAGYSGAPRDVWIRGNIFAYSDEHQVCPAVQRYPWVGSRFEGNVILWDRGSLGNAAPFGWEPLGVSAGKNWFWSEEAPLKLTDGNSLEYWMSRGQLAGSEVRDPLFLAPRAGDFRARPDSPLLGSGFQPPVPAGNGPRLIAGLPLSYLEWLRAFPDEPDRPVVSARADQRGNDKVVLCLANPGRMAANVRYHLETPEQVRAHPRESVQAELEPGERKTFTFEIHGGPGNHRIGFLPDSPDFTPAFANVELGLATWELPELSRSTWPQLAALENRDLCNLVKELTSGAHGESCFAGDHKAATLRLVRAGDYLLFQAQVRDTRIERAWPGFWDGSHLELFIAPGLTERPVQVVLIPDPASGEVLTHRQHGFTPVLLSEVRAAWVRNQDGYELAALLPAAIFGLTPSVRDARIEFGGGAHLSPDQASASKFSRFGAPEPHNVARGMAHFIWHGE